MSEPITVTVHVGGQAAGAAQFEMGGDLTAPPPPDAGAASEADDLPPEVEASGASVSTDDAMAPPPDVDAGDGSEDLYDGAGGDSEIPPPPEV